MGRQTRRQFLRGGFALASVGLLAGCGVLAPPAPQPRIPRIGYLALGASWTGPLGAAFRQELRELGYIEGQTVAFEPRGAEGVRDRLPGLAEELARLPVDLIVAPSTPAARAAKFQTSTIPIVMVIDNDPLRTGLIEGLEFPGRNITGLSTASPQLSGKRLALLKEAVPRVGRIAVLWNAGVADNRFEFRDTQAAAAALGLELQSLELRDADDLAEALEAATREPPDALLVLADPLLVGLRAELVDFAARRRLPALYDGAEFAEAGGLLAYGPNYADLYRRAAGYVAKILRGTKPADLPIEQPAKFDFIINLKTAQALGLTIPQSVLAQATDLIQ
jgi:putative ABC transport system substrate-binding protein